MAVSRLQKFGAWTQAGWTLVTTGKFRPLNDGTNAFVQYVTPLDESGAVIGGVGSGAKFANFAANTAGVQVKSGAGTFLGLSVNTAGATSTATLYDGTSTAGAKIGTYSTTAVGGPVIPAGGIAFATGLFLVLAGGTPADVTVSYI